MRVLIVVTHLLGTGHLVRAVTLGRAFAQRGWQVQIASGGRPVPHLDTSGVTLTQLPPLHVEGVDFGTLFGPSGPADARYRQARIAQLLACLEPAPDLIITELFPFGRRNLRDEFLALLDARSAPVLASVRDILAPPSKPERAAWTHEVLRRHYRGVLIHADPTVIPLEQSWPVSPDIAPRLHYTGFVAPPTPEPHPQNDGKGEVLISAGGGPVGAALLAAAKSAAALDPGRVWRCLIRECDADLSANLPNNLRIEAPRPDFRQMLCGAYASVSMCGYNTAMDLMQTGVPAVLVPFDEGGEVEQSMRADALARHPGFVVLRRANLNGHSLREAVQRVTIQPRRASQTQAMNGAEKTVEIAEKLLHAR